MGCAPSVAGAASACHAAHKTHSGNCVQAAELILLRLMISSTCRRSFFGSAAGLVCISCQCQLSILLTAEAQSCLCTALG